MPRREVDPVRVRSALAVVREHPGMLLFLASPGLIVIACVWWLLSPVVALVLLAALLLIGGGAVLLKR
jgi:hypothetical protein